VSRLNLEHQRKRARALLKGVRLRDAESLDRMSRASELDGTAIALHEAQLVVARENGFSSWSKLKAHARSDSPASPLMLSSRLFAVNRALETTRQHPLYRDPLADRLAGAEGWAVWHAWRQSLWPGFGSAPDPYLTIATRFFDDALLAAVRDAGIMQVVIVRAGMDTRAFRLDWPPNVCVFEVDTADVFAHKEPILRRLDAQPLCHRQTIITRSLGSLKRALRRSDFDPAQKTAFLIERLQYLPPEGADRALGEITRLAAEGSWIGLSLVTDATLRSEFMRPFLQKLEFVGLPPWRFGIDEPEQWLARYGWRSSSVVLGAPEASYGRWPYAYIPREQPGIPRAFLTVGWKHRGEDAWSPSL
jgi:methyltransferase (TIGR00027 family)